MAHIWTFFYGSYINLDVLREVELAPRDWSQARLSGYDIWIEPRANLVPSPEHCVYGMASTVTHDELDRLYAHARDVLGEVYRPHPVLIELDGGYRPALCYLCATMKRRPAEAPYVDRILRPARAYGFPLWYLHRIERFRPAP